MKRFLILFILSLCVVVALSINARVVNKKSESSKTNKSLADVPSIVDSALIMADNYADALKDKPEMAQPRLNALKTYTSAKPIEIQDSICSKIYSFFVTYTEQGKTDRADAFKECFLSLAQPDNEFLGPLYATELTIAREITDTTAIKKYIPLLEEYSQRMGFDYDDELAEAQKFVKSIRTRKPLAQAIAGIWVSEDIAGIEGIENDDFRGVWWDEWFEPYFGQVILQIRNASDTIYNCFEYDNGYRIRALRPDSITGLVIIPHSGKRENGWGSNKFDGIIDKWEASAHNVKDENNGAKSSTLTKNWFLNQLYETTTFSDIQIDEPSYSLYAFYGDEKFKRNDAEIGAILRQSNQEIQAQVAGNLSRNRYNTGERIAGNLVSGAVSIGINSLVDAMMVSTDRIKSCEITLHMINPYCLEVEILAQKIISNSNSTTATPYVVNRKVRYYRWEPQDNVSFVGTHLDNCSKDIYCGLAGMYFLYNISKEEIKKEDNKKKIFEKAYHDKFKTQIKEYKNQLKKLKKNSEEYNKLKKELENYKNGESGVKAWKVWNAASLDKLKAKSDNYQP